MNENGGAHNAIGAAGERYRALSGTLYVVATPVGNLRDVTLRSLDILGSVDAVAAEDTRVTAVLLRHYGIATRPFALHEHNELARADEIVTMLSAGRSVAVVSDAGTPGISDPGARLVRRVRDAGLPVVPIPGPSAAVAAFSIAGLTAERFVFLGFLPATAKAQRELLAAVAHLPFALVVYEAPHRVRATIARMTLIEGPGWFAADPNHAKGEFVLLVDAPLQGEDAMEGRQWDARRLLAALVTELSPARAARVAAAATGLSRETLYAQAIALKESRG